MPKKPTKSPARWVWGVVLSVLSGSLLAATPPGSSIVNIASVEYTQGSGSFGLPVTVQSNTVVTVVAPGLGLVVVKSHDPGGAVAPGTSVTFHLSIQNPGSSDLSSVVLDDPLDLLLGPPSAITSGLIPNRGPTGGSIAVTGVYVLPSRTVNWVVPLIPAGARFELSFTTQISSLTPEDSVVRNTSRQTSTQDPAGTSSNEVLVPVISPALSIRKEASRNIANVGEPIGFTIDVANISPVLDLHSVTVRDLLPKGLRYLEGSARLDGKAVPDPSPAARKSRELLFPAGDLSVGDAHHLAFVAIPDPSAEGDDTVNKAWVDAVTPAGYSVSAGPAQASVRVSGSFAPAETVIVGRVFVDDNHNGFFEDGEVGVPSARVYLEDGTFTLTDVVGKYHIEAVRPGLHVVKVDAATLPDGLASFASWSRSAGGAGTQFVDSGGGELFKSNVATGGLGIAVSRLRARGSYRNDRKSAPAGNPAAGEALLEVVFPPVLASALFEPGGAGLTASARTVVESYASLIRERGGRLVALTVEPVCFPVADERLMNSRADRLSREMSRLLMASAAPAKDGTATADAALIRGASGVMSAAGTTTKGDLETLEAMVKEMTPEAAILQPEEGQAIAAERSAVDVKFPNDLTPRLKVNGEVIAMDQIGVRMETSRSGVIFCRYIGIPFREGRNSIILEGFDQWGNARVWVERIVIRVGQPGRLTIRPAAEARKADARTPIAVRVQVQDAEGLPVADGTMVTLEADMGDFIGADASAVKEGFQATTAGGTATVYLSPAATAGNRTITAMAGEAKGETTFSLDPELRDWIVAGVGEGTIGQRGFAAGTDLDDALAGAGAGGRLALFARGRLFGSSLMTLSYDSDRERDPDKLFRAVSPDRYFPIYGDSSTQGYAVEGQGKFSLRMDQARSSFTLGDFATGLTVGELVRYDRALTGGAGRLDMRGFSVQSFGATTPQTQMRDELQGGGISGPYRLTRTPLVVNSERVVLEARDRFHEERVISSRTMSRYSDYDVDYEGGTIFFKQAVPFQDDDFNPIFIVAIYETLDAGGDRSSVAGGRVGYRFGERAQVGTTYVNEARDTGAFILRGADAGYKQTFGSGTVEFHGEAATTESGTSAPAGAVSFRAKATIGRSIGLTGYYRNVASGFENASRAGSSDSGTVRYGLDGSAALSDGSRLKGEFFSQSDALRGQDRRVASLGWDRNFGRITARSGFTDLRALNPSNGGNDFSRLVSAGAGFRLSSRWEAMLGRQQVVAGAALTDFPTRTSAGLTCRVTEQIRGFLRQEYDQADAGDASRTVVGMETRLTGNTVMESRYSLEDALNGARGFAQMGIRTRLPLNQDWLSDLSVERVATTQGISTGDFTSLAVGFEYLPATVKFTTRYELRLGEQNDTHVLTTAGARRLSDSLSLFTRERLFLVNPDSGGARFDGDGLLGLAYRPVDNDRLNFLVKLQGLKGSGTQGATAPLAKTYLGIFEMNYQPVNRVHLLGRLAYKESLDSFDQEDFASRSWLTEGRVLFDIRDRVSAGLTVRYLNQPTIGTNLFGAGIETGYRVTNDLWVVGGYNLTGFSQKGFGDADKRETGPFLSVRFKFDEESLAGISQAFRPNPEAR